MLLAAAVQLVFGWTKSFPVSIGRPGCARRRSCSRSPRSCRSCSCSASLYGATGAAGGVLGSSAVFAAFWPSARAAARRRSPTWTAPSREGPDRLGDLAARRRRPGEPRARARGVAARARPSGRGRRRPPTRRPRRRPIPSAGSSRRLPPGSATRRALALDRARARDAPTSSTRPAMFGRSALGARARAHAVRRRSSPSDPAFERARRRGLVDGRARRASRPAAAASSRRAPRCCATRGVRRAAHVVCPSAYLARARRPLARCRASA